MSKTSDPDGLYDRVPRSVRGHLIFGLVLLVLSVNLLGDWLRDALNPRLH